MVSYGPVGLLQNTVVSLVAGAIIVVSRLLERRPDSDVPPQHAVVVPSPLPTAAPTAAVTVGPTVQASIGAPAQPDPSQRPPANDFACFTAEVLSAPPQWGCHLALTHPRVLRRTPGMYGSTPDLQREAHAGGIARTIRRLNPEAAQFYADVYVAAKTSCCRELRRWGCSGEEAEEIFMATCEKVMSLIDPIARAA